MSAQQNSILLRLTASKVPALVVGLLFYLVLMGILSLIFLLEGIPFLLANYEFFALFGLAFAYVVFVTRLIHNVHLRDFESLLNAANLTPSDLARWRSKIHQHPRQWVEGVIAMGVGLTHAYLQGYGRLLDGTSRFVLYDIWGVFQMIFIWVVVTLSTSIFIRNMTVMNELSREVEIDLLNLERFMPLTRSGVWSILGFIGVYSILFAQGIKGISLTNPAILVLGPSIFWMIRTPLKGFRQRVIKAKEKELEIVDRAIEGDHNALKDSRISANLDNINVIDLINYKKMIQNTFEIPVNIPTASRFVFYLIIPLLTWIAASMVDKVIDYLIK